MEHVRLLVVMMYYTPSTYQRFVRNPQLRLDRVKENPFAIEVFTQGWSVTMRLRPLRAADSPSD